MKFMRFVVRPGCEGGVVGINHGLFKEGVVYEVVELIGEYMVRVVGPSPLGAPPRRGYPNNGRDFNSLYAEHGGDLARTVDEIEASLSHRGGSSQS